MSNNYTGNVVSEILQKSVDILRFILYTSLSRVTKETRIYGILAQLGEHLPYKQRVIGSSPIGPILLKMARWLNWLERPVHTREVESSSLSLATVPWKIFQGIFLIQEYTPLFAQFLFPRRASITQGQWKNRRACSVEQNRKIR